jgi:hypothetical protein
MASNLSEMLAFSSADCEEMLRAAVEAYAADRLSVAETILVGLITLNGEDKDVRPIKLLAAVLMAQGRHRDAERIYEQSLHLDPDDPDTLVALGELKLKTLEIGAAVPLFEKLFAADPNGEHPAANRGRHIVRQYHDRLKDTH